MSFFALCVLFAITPLPPEMHWKRSLEHIFCEYKLTASHKATWTKLNTQMLNTNMSHDWDHKKRLTNISKERKCHGTFLETYNIYLVGLYIILYRSIVIENVGNTETKSSTPRYDRDVSSFSIDEKSFKEWHVDICSIATISSQRYWYPLVSNRYIYLKSYFNSRGDLENKEQNKKLTSQLIH